MGGFTPPADDIPGRIMGEIIGKQAFEQAKTLFNATLLNNEVYQNIYVFPNPINPDRFVISGTASDYKFFSLTSMDVKFLFNPTILMKLLNKLN